MRWAVQSPAARQEFFQKHGDLYGDELAMALYESVVLDMETDWEVCKRKSESETTERPKAKAKGKARAKAKAEELPHLQGAAPAAGDSEAPAEAPF